MKTAIIINPHAGRKRALRQWVKLERELQKHEYVFDTFFTNGPMHAVTIMEEIKGKYEKFILVSGDGTFNEILQNFIPEQNILGLVGCGTGNDLLRSLETKKDIKSTAQRIMNFNIREIDLWQANGRVFANGAGIGFDAEVVNDVNRKGKTLFPKLDYFASIFHVLFSYKPTKVKINVDGTIFEDQIMLCLNSNGRFIGGGMMIAPSAKLDDQLLYICIIKAISKLRFLKEYPSIFSGNHVKKTEFVKVLTGKSVKISAAKPMHIQADGEAIGVTPLEISLCPYKLKILID